MITNKEELIKLLQKTPEQDIKVSCEKLQPEDCFLTAPPTNCITRCIPIEIRYTVEFSIFKIMG